MVLLSTIEVSTQAILEQNGFKIIDKKRSPNSTLLFAKKGKLGGKKACVMISTSGDLLEALNKERELHRQKGFKLKILFTACEAAQASFEDIIVIKDSTELSQALNS